MSKLSFLFLYYFLVVLCSLFAIVVSIVEFLRHPLSYFHQKKRDGELCVARVLSRSSHVVVATSDKT